MSEDILLLEAVAASRTIEANNQRRRIQRDRKLREQAVQQTQPLKSDHWIDINDHQAIQAQREKLKAIAELDEIEDKLIQKAAVLGVVISEKKLRESGAGLKIEGVACAAKCQQDIADGAQRTADEVNRGNIDLLVRLADNGQIIGTEWSPTLCSKCGCSTSWCECIQ